MTTKLAGGIAGRVGRWSARHEKTAIFGWLGLIALAVVLGGNVVAGAAGFLAGPTAGKPHRAARRRRAARRFSAGPP